MTTFLDTNILVDVLDPTAERHSWSVEELNKARANGPVIVSDVTYCEFSVAMPTREATDRAIAELQLERMRCSDDSLFTAGKAFKKYRKEHGGSKTRVLPDFLIGAQAATEKSPLLTANPKDLRSYFPDLKIVYPPKKMR